MRLMRRRQLLSGVPVIGLCGISGCLGSQLFNSSPTQVCGVTVINRYPEQVQSRIEITTESGITVENTVDLNPPGETTDTHDFTADDLPTEVESVVTLSVVGEDWDLQEEYTTADEERDSISIVWILEGSSQEENKPVLRLLTSQEDTRC